jgi:cobalt-zinc-cadmium efflux system outer membrane protein
MTNFRGPLCAVLTGAIASAAIPAAAQQAPPFPALLSRAEATAPKLMEAAADLAQAKSLARQASVRPNPNLEISVENFAGTGSVKGFDEAETTAQISQPLEFGGKRSARRAAGDAAVQAAQARQTQTRAQFAHDVAIAYAQAEAADRRMALAEEAASLAQEDLRAAEVLVRAGRESDLRAVQARAALEAAHAQAETARAERAAAMADLSALAGERYNTVSGGLLIHADGTEQFREPVALSSPAYLAAEAERDVTARRVQIEQSRAKGDGAISLGVRRLSGPGATALVGGFSIPLPVSDRNRDGISAAQAELRGAEARLMGARLSTEAQGRAAQARASAAQARLKASRQSEAAAEEAYRLTRLGYDGGKVPLAELLTARQALSAAHEQALQARLERLTAEADLARLEGVAPFGDHR